MYFSTIVINPLIIIIFIVAFVYHFPAFVRLKFCLRFNYNIISVNFILFNHAKDIFDYLFHFHSVHDVYNKDELGWIWARLQFSLPNLRLGVEGFDVLLEFPPKNISIL